MRVPCVAVGTAEGAADVGIDRPEAHLRDLRVIEDVLRARAHVRDVALLPEHGELARGALVGVGEERGLDEGHGRKSGATYVPNISRRCKTASRRSRVAEKSPG